MSDNIPVQDTVERKHALVLYVMELFSQIDEIASLKKAGHPATLSSYMLKETCSVLNDLDEETLTEYLDIIVQLGSNRGATKLLVPDDDYVEAISEKRKDFLKEIKTKLVA